MLVLQDQERLQSWEKCSYAQRSKKNDDKSTVAMWKKFELHDRKGQPVVGRDTSHEPSQQSQGVINDLDNVDFLPLNVNSSHQEALLYVFEDDEAVMKMIEKEEVPQ